MKKLIPTLTLATIVLVSQQGMAQNMPNMEHNRQQGSHQKTQNSDAKMPIDHNNHSSSKAMPGKQAIYAAGVINKISSGKLNITHEPIAALGWPKMKMDFNVAKGANLPAVKPGQRIHFSLVKTGKFKYEITSIHPWVHNVEDHNM